jgi:hypothetical protein
MAFFYTVEGKYKIHSQENSNSSNNKRYICHSWSWNTKQTFQYYYSDTTCMTLKAMYSGKSTGILHHIYFLQSQQPRNYVLQTYDNLIYFLNNGVINVQFALGLSFTFSNCLWSCQHTSATLNVTTKIKLYINCNTYTYDIICGCHIKIQHKKVQKPLQSILTRRSVISCSMHSAITTGTICSG